MALQRQNDRAVVGGIGLVSDEGPAQVESRAGAVGRSISRKVASQHRIRGEGCLRWIRGALDGVLPTGKEEEFVLLDRSPNRSAKLIAFEIVALYERRLAAGERGVSGVEHEIPHVFEGVSV